MRTHLLALLTALFISSCANHRDLASTTDRSGYNQEESQHAQMIDTGASARGNSRQ